MSAANLINLNPDTLFEQHGVPEIEIIQQKIRAVVEGKREELRTMVGERYRDLLKAADTIGTMKESSSALIAQVESITNNCRSLNEQQLLGFKTTDTVDIIRSRQANKQLNNYFSTMIQIKLLTSLPELIWSNLDQERFYVATQLFIFSRHISTGLQLDASNVIMQHLPVAKKQWELLKPFQVTIKQRVVKALEREELRADVATDCLLSLLLLEKSNLNATFRTFLQLRSNAFKNCLTDDVRNVSEHRRVKERILASLRVLNSTVDLIGCCFLENGMLFQKLSEHADANALPTLALMDSNDRQFSHLMPEIISNFRPKIEAHNLDAALVHVAFEKWLSDSKRIADVHLRDLFELVTTMKTIEEIKSEAHGYRKHLNFSEFIEKFALGQSLDFYELKYAPLINQRVRDIVNNSWTSAINETFATLQEDLQKVNESVPSFWNENVSDLPLSLESALGQDLQSKKLLMKLKGYDEAVISLCSKFDSRLDSIISELNVLLTEQATRAEDKLALVDFLRSTAHRHITELVAKVRSLRLKQHQRRELLFVVRVFVALVELCPHLRVCFCPQKNWRQWVGNMAGSGLGHWNRICAFLDKETFIVWRLIVDSILMENHYTQYLSQTLTHESVLVDFTNWETVTLEQSDEQDNAVTSSFRIPVQPSISLQNYIFSLIRALNADVPQTLPERILKMFNYKLLINILQVYQQKVATQLTQNAVLQLYFDIRFVQGIFGIAREEPPLHQPFQKLHFTLKELIDPIDYELFADHIAVNVKRAVARLQWQFGVLVPQCATSAAAAVPIHDKDPNVLSISTPNSTTLWFPLLPIVSQAAINEERQLKVDKQTTPTRKTQSVSGRRSDTAGKSKSGAASFFGAMSQDWFR